MTLYSNSASGYGSWVVPAGVTSVNVFAIAAGAGGANYSTGYAMGGGGGASVKTTGLTVVPTHTVYFYVAPGGTQSANGANSWINIAANAAPTAAANGCLALGGQANGSGYANTAGGNGSLCIGTTAYSGGTGVGTNQYGCAGGGGAGSAGAGANSVPLTGDTANNSAGGSGGPSDGTFPAGGVGGNVDIAATASPSGYPGVWPGGGGGGGGNTGGNAGVGASGANGGVWISYAAGAAARRKFYVVG